MDYTKHPLKIFFSYYKPHVGLFIADMICAFFMAAIDVAFPMFTRYALNTLIPNHQLRTFLILVAILFAGFCLHKACNWFVAYWGHVFGNRVEQDMRRDVFDHLEKLPFSFYDTNRTGKIMARATTDLFEITELAHHGPEDFSIAMLNLIGSFVLLLTIRWELAIIVFIMLPLIFFIVYTSRKNLTQASTKVKETTAEVNAGLESSISGIRVTKGFNNEEFERERFAVYNKQYRYTALLDHAANKRACHGKSCGTESPCKSVKDVTSCLTVLKTQGRHYGLVCKLDHVNECIDRKDDSLIVLNKHKQDRTGHYKRNRNYDEILIG